MTDVMPDRPASAARDLDAKYREDAGTFFFTGVQALVRAPMDQMREDRRAGLKTATFFSGYQGSPLGGFDRELIAHKAILDSLNMVHQPGLNEELGATAVMGSQMASTFPQQRYDGVLGVWYGKSPGVDRAGDAMRHAAYAGTHPRGGVLALAGDDPSNKSSTLPSSSENSLADLHMGILHPGNVQEVLDLALHGIALSRAAGLWTAIKIVTAVADGSGNIDVGPGRVKPEVPVVEYNGKPFVPRVNPRLGGAPANAMEPEIYEARMEVARLYGVLNKLNRVTVDAPDAWLGIVASGHVYHEVIEALHGLGLNESALRSRGIRLMQINQLFPLDRGTLRAFGSGLEEILVVEEKRPFIETAVRDALYGTANAPRVVGKRDPDDAKLVPIHGALDADTIVAPLRRRLLTKLAPEVLAPEAPKAAPVNKLAVLPTRTPYYCSGCPHSTGTKAPEDALVGSGIGCHGLVGLMDPKRVGNITGNTQMGGEGVQWVGIEPFVQAQHFIQNLGDGTFAHSGSLCIRQAVAAKSHITFKVLYNGAVAMTGGQDAAGAMPVDKLATWALCEGVSRVIITTDEREKYKGVNLAGGVEVWDRERILDAQKTLAGTPGVTLLIHDQQCAAEKRRDRKRGIMVEPKMRIVINERVCEGCGDCGVQSNCLSVQPVDTMFGRKTQIHQSSCNKDYTCIQGDCPSFLSVEPAKGRAAAGKTTRAQGGARRRPAVDTAGLPTPTPLFGAGDVTIRMPGIGGTGVVTVSQILGTAATLDGRYVNGIDQTGLSQKAGPVVSDLHITRQPLEGANKLTAGSADLYLVFDLIVGLSSSNLHAVAPERTVAVVSTSKTPTGMMVRDVKATYPDDELLKADLDAVTRKEHNRYVDTIAVTEGLFGESTTANIFQLGVAYQIGALPVSGDAILQAIELNGAAVDANKLAFQWGRVWAVDPERVRQASVTPEDQLPKPSGAVESHLAAAGFAGDGTLAQAVRVRAGDLGAYQNDAYAKRYVDVVRKAAATGDDRFALAVARNLYKLMAYKDEYEVARLHLEEAARLKVEQAVGENMKVSWNLHPPLLRAMGLKHKIRMSSTLFAPVMKALRAGKVLRGTPLDPFGYAEVRRVERSLVKEYTGLVESVVKRYGSVDADRVVELANLPDMVRGYEQIKLNNVEAYRSELARLKSVLAV